MNIAVIGAGRVGSTLGRRLAEAGHTIHYARRDPTAEVPGAPSPLGEELPERLQHPGATLGATAEVVARAEVVLLATPWAAAEAALAKVPDFEGRPLLDVTNPIGPGFALTHGHSDSGAEQVQRWAPTARVVKVFNSTGMENMADPVYGDHRALMLACGDDEAARNVAVQLATDVGFDARPFGDLAQARLLEPLALVWIKLAMVHGLGRGFALGILER